MLLPMRLLLLSNPALRVVAAGIALAVMASCGSGKKETTDVAETLDSNKANIVAVGDKLFSIPSPIQTAMLLKKCGAAYNKSMLNIPANITHYSTTVKKALNLGAYGADLGYVILYQQNQDAMGYLSIIKKLSDDVGISGAFNEQLLKRFQSNIGNRDSLLAMSSEAYRSSDAFLKENDRTDASALILAGGWIEGLYFTTQMVSGKVTDKSALIQRIGEQKTTLDNLISLLTKYYQQEGYTEFIDALIDLASEFDKVEMSYTYVKPTTDEANKLTTINCTTTVKLPDELLKTITEKAAALRNSVIQ